MPAKRQSTRKRPARKTAKPRKPRAPGKRALNKEATRNRIVTAALSLFQSKGFDATTTKAIARKAQIAEGTVFNYFATKEDIALHFFELEVDHAIAAVRADRRLRKASLEEKLFALVQSQLEFLSPYERFIGASLTHALKPASALGPFSPRMQALRLRYVSFVQELVEESMPEQRGTPMAMWAPQAFWIYYLGALLYWLHDASPGKQHTLAFLDRTLTIGAALLRRDKP